MMSQKITDQKHITKQHFAGLVERAIWEAVGGEAEISLQTVRKNNGIMMTGISIFRKERNISPTIYLESYYERYLAGESVKEIAEEILACDREHSPEISFDTDFFMDYELAKERIAYRLVNREKNRKLLEEIPFIPYLDLAITFFCKVEHDELGCGIIQIRNEHARLWGVEKEQLFRDAEKNMRTLYPELVCTMQELLQSVENEPEIAETMAEEVERSQELSVYVVTNSYKSYGAAVMLYEGVLDDLTQRMKSSIAILPSSVHELIVLPVKSVAEASELRGMVHEINRTQVEPEEVLTDSVYYYGKHTRTLTISV